MTLVRVHGQVRPGVAGASWREDVERGFGEAALNHCREPLAEVDDLHQPKRAADVNHTTERILAIGFPESHVEARRPEPGSLPHKLPHESPFYDSSHHFEATNKR